MAHRLLSATFAATFGPGTRARPRERRRLVPRLLPEAESLETRLLATVTVHVFDFDFSTNPAGQPVVDPVIHVGDTVHWVWDDGMHSTTSAAGQQESWDSGVHMPNFSFDHTFTHAGVFSYFCSVHGVDNGHGTVGGMSGKITVMANVTLTSLAVTTANPTLGKGETEHLEAVGSFSDGTTEDLTSQATWASSNTAVATISDAAGSKGLVSALAAGTSTITASLNGITGGTTLTVTDAPSPTPLVTVTHVSLVLNRRRMVTQILVTFSGPVEGHGADDSNTYRLATAGRRGSFDARNAQVIRLRSASLDATGTVATLVPRRAFALAKPVQLRINGLPPAGLEDRLGRLIDGDHDGVPGGNALTLLRRGGVVVPLVSRRLPSSVS